MDMGYEAGKIEERKWGVYFRLDEHTSFGPKAVHSTKKAAQRDAENRNRYEREAVSRTGTVPLYQ